MQVLRGDILLMDLENPPSGMGREQAGVRPTVVISMGDVDPDNPMVTVIPLTGTLESQRFPHTILINPSFQNRLTCTSVALIFQIRSLDKNRIIRVAGKLETSDMTRVESLLRRMLSL